MFVAMAAHKDAFRSNLRTLHMFDNKSGDATVLELCQLFGGDATKKASLQLWNLSYNRIGDAGARAIARHMLAHNRSNLTQLFLSCNYMTYAVCVVVTNVRTETSVFAICARHSKPIRS